MKRYLLLLTLVSGIGVAAIRAPTDYRAVLALPATISISGDLYKVQGKVSIRWDTKDPLVLRVWSDGVGDTIHGSPSIFDESGKKVRCWEPLASYVPYDTDRRLAEGDEISVTLKIDEWAEFAAPGRYYAVMEVYGSLESGKVVSVTTEKCWFFVTDQKEEMPNQPPQRNAGSRPSSGDSHAPETPSSLGPRG